MKQKHMTHYCIDKDCDWKETSHKIRDGIKCPKCNGPVMTAVMVTPNHQSIEDYLFDVFKIPKELLTQEQAQQIESQYKDFARTFGLTTPR